MAVYYATNSASALRDAFNQAIANHHRAGVGQRVDTWRHVLHDRRDFYTHTSANWKDKAWFRADLEANRLAFHILAFDRVPLTRDIYAYYAGHLIETFIRHFPTMFTIAQGTPNAAGADARF
jgi:hypothetical protein